MKKFLSVSNLYDIYDKLIELTSKRLAPVSWQKESISFEFDKFCKMYNYLVKNNNDVKVFYDNRYDIVLELYHTRYNNVDNFIFEYKYSALGSSHMPVYFNHRLVYQYKIDMLTSKIHEFIKLQDEKLKTTHIFKSGHLLANEYKKLGYYLNIKQGTKVIVLDEQVVLSRTVNEDKYSKTWIRIR